MKKYNVSLTEAEVRMIKTALETEAGKRAEAKSERTRDFERLANSFDDVLIEIYNHNI